MNLTAFFGLLGGLLVLAFVANRQYRRTRVPDVIVLLAVGLLLGPGLGLLKAQQFQQVTHAFGALAIILILFEGGLELNLRETLRHFPGGLVFGFLAYAMSLGLISLVVRGVLQVPWLSALLAGAVMGCVSSSIVLPVLQQLKLREPVRVTLLIEASLGDVLAVLTVSVLLDFADGGGSVLGSLVGGFMAKMGVSLLLAVLTGWLWSRLLPWLSEQRFWNVLTLSAVLLLYAGAELAHASGLIAVLGFGLVLSNFPGIDRRVVESAIGAEAVSPEHHQRVLTFHSELAFLVRTFFFVLLGVVVEFKGLRGYAALGLGALGALIVARWLAVRLSQWAWKSFDALEHEVILWMMPRGLITAVLAIQVFQERGEEFGYLPALTFAIILATNLFLLIAGLRAQRAQAPAEGLAP